MAVAHMQTLHQGGLGAWRGKREGPPSTEHLFLHTTHKPSPCWECLGQGRRPSLELCIELSLGCAEELLTSVWTACLWKRTFCLQMQHERAMPKP